MIEKYFALKYTMTIASFIFVILCIIAPIIITIIEIIIETFRENRNGKILKKYNYVKDLDCYNQWCYYVNGIKIRENELCSYKPIEIKKMIKEEKKGSQ